MSGIRDRYRALRPGLSVGPETNNQDFWDILFGRPSAVLFLVLFGGIRVITPNLLTWLSLFLKLAVAGLVYWGDYTDWLWATVLLQLSCTFDCADGQLARYRGVSSLIGGYLDKVVDCVGFLFLFAALGDVAFQETGAVYYVHMSGLVMFALLLSGYVKWIAVAEVLERGGSRTEAGRRTAALVKWWHVPFKAFEFNEGDLHLWIGLALVLERVPWVMWLLVATQTIMAIGSVVHRGSQLRAAE